MNQDTRLPRNFFIQQGGQSVVEVTLTLPLLLMLVLALVEMGIVFGSFISLANATHEGAVFAAMHPELADASCGSTPYDTCVVTNVDTRTLPGGTTLWAEYFNRVNSEIVVLVSNPLREKQILDQDTLTVYRPVVGPASSPSCTNPKNISCPITVTVSYRIHTFMTDMSLPGVGRLGLPDFYQISYSVQMPIR